MFGSCDLPMGFCEATEPVAAKSHACCECDAPINPGEKHVKLVGVWDGELSSFRQHVACAEVCEYARDNFGGGECLPFGSFKEWWEEEGKYIHSNEYLNPDDVELIKKLRALLAKVRYRELWFSTKRGPRNNQYEENDNAMR